MAHNVSTPTSKAISSSFVLPHSYVFLKSMVSMYNMHRMSQARTTGAYMYAHVYSANNFDWRQKKNRNKNGMLTINLYTIHTGTYKILWPFISNTADKAGCVYVRI